MVALDDWMREVMMVPIRTKMSTDMNHLSVYEARKSKTSGLFFTSGTDCFRNCNPINKTADPIINSPHDRRMLFFEKNNGKLIPIRGKDRKLRLTLNPNRDIIQAVTVVPIFAPMITPTAAINDSSPALTKLTTITVVAEDD